MNLWKVAPHSGSFRLPEIGTLETEGSGAVGLLLLQRTSGDHVDPSLSLLLTDLCSEELLQKTFVVRVRTVDAEGFPYVVPQLFVYENGKVWLHQTSAKGHLRCNLEFSSKVCLEFDEHGEFFPYGATQCDTVVAYKSVIAFGSLRFVTSDEEKLNFFDKFTLEYAGASWGREEHTYPRMDPTAVYEVQLETVIGKHQEADVTLTRWNGAEGQVGGPGSYSCPFHKAILEAEAQTADMNGGNIKEI